MPSVIDFSFLHSAYYDTIKTTPKDPLQVPIRPITRSKVKKLKNTFNELIQKIQARVDFKETTSTSKYQSLVNLIYAREGFDPSTSWDN